MADPMQQLATFQAGITQITQALLDEITSLKKLTQELKSQNTTLLAKHDILLKENEALKLSEADLQEENEELNKELDLKEPLVACGMSVRCRFLAQAGERLGSGPANASVVEEGNRAAHRGNFEADSAMFLLKQMHTLPGSDEDSEEGSDGADAGFVEMYGGLFSNVYQLKGERPWEGTSSAVEMEFFSLCGSMQSLVPTLVHANDLGEDQNWGKFHGYAKACVRICHSGKTQSEVEVDPDLELSLKGMRIVVDQIAQEKKRRRYRQEPAHLSTL